MTIPRVSITCDQFADKLSEYLEREADEATRASIDAHALSCAECGQLLADLRALRLGAANLPELVPSRDLWKGISERIETPVVELKNGAAVVQSQIETRRRTRLWTGLAAAALVGVTATVTYEVTKRSVGATSPVVVAATTQPAPSTTPSAIEPARDTISKSRPAAGAPAATLVADRPSAQQTYDTEIARLRVVVERRRSQLDSTTVAVLEHNLKVIDDAIRQCRAALLKDPGSQFLMESLNDALDNKVQLLRTAATLPSKA